MSRERGSSLHHRISELVDKRKVGLDPKEAFVNHVWPEVENDYQGMADELAKLCKEELSIRKVPAAVESRIKSRDSIAKSLERREIYRQARSEEPYKDIREILLDLHDLVGIRIIVDYIDQIKTATDFITGTFHKEKDPNVFSANRKAGRSWTSWFGAYECTNHHVSAKYAESSNLSCYNGVIFEIQVTSLPANLYNRIAHPLLYKGEAGELSQGDEIVIDLTRGLAFCYSLCTYYKRYKLNEEKCIGDDEMELLRNASSTTEGPVFMSSISDLAGRIPGVDTAKIKGKSIPRERLEMVLESLLNKEIQSDIGRYVADQLKYDIHPYCHAPIRHLTVNIGRRSRILAGPALSFTLSAEPVSIARMFFKAQYARRVHKLEPDNTYTIGSKTAKNDYSGFVVMLVLGNPLWREP